MNIRSDTSFELSEFIENSLRTSSERIFTIAGPNGAGKSRLLRNTSGYLARKDIFTIYVPAHRSIRNTTPYNFKHLEDRDPNLRELWLDLIHRINQTSGKVSSINLDEAIFSILKVALYIDAKTQEKFKENLYNLYMSGNKTESIQPPNFFIDNIQKKLEEILGYQCRISPRTKTDHENPDVFFTYDGKNYYPSSHLSDGEKQVLLISILLIFNSEEEIALLIDEPELHLNEAKAISIWESVERNFPKAIFVYATHSISFSQRSTVDRKYFLKNYEELVLLSNERPISREIITQLAGPNIQVHRARECIVFCEDEMHRLLLEDILGKELTIAPIGSCEEVIKTVKGEVGWQELRSNAAPFCGVIDLDTRSLEEAEILLNKKIVCFPVYDAESVLLSSKMATWFLGLTKGQDISTGLYEQWLIEAANQTFHKMLALTASKVTTENYIELKYLGDPLEDSWSLTQKQPIDLNEIFTNKARILKSAINEKNVENILRLYKGKELYKKLQSQSQSKFGIQLPRKPEEQYIQIRTQTEFKTRIENVSWIKTLKEEIYQCLDNK